MTAITAAVLTAAATAELVELLLLVASTVKACIVAVLAVVVLKAVDLSASDIPAITVAAVIPPTALPACRSVTIAVSAVLTLVANAEAERFVKAVFWVSKSAADNFEYTFTVEPTVTEADNSRFSAKRLPEGHVKRRVVVSKVAELAPVAVEVTACNSVHPSTDPQLADSEKVAPVSTAATDATAIERTLASIAHDGQLLQSEVTV